MYLIYQLSDGLVVETTETSKTPPNGCGIVYSTAHKLGDEFEFTIHIEAIDDDGNIVYMNAVRNNPQASRLLTENAQLKQENALLAFELLNTQIRLDQTEAEQANLLLTLVEKGVV